MNYLFYLDDVEIDEPNGFADIELSIKRDDKLHGIVFEASTTTLGFYGAAATYLKEQKELYGISAAVTLRVMATCDTYDYEEILSGRLNFGKYKESCGDNCIVSMPWEEQSCHVVMRSRYDLKIDMDKQTAVDGFTGLEDYAGLSVETELPAHKLQASVEGSVLEGGDVVDLDIFSGATENFWVRPTYGQAVYESINESQLVPSVFAAANNGVNDSIISPVLLFDDDIECFSGSFDYEVRMKGSYDYSYGLGSSDIDSLTLIVAYGEFPSALTVLHSQALSFSGRVANGTFDYTYSGTVSLPEGKGFYAYIENLGGALPITLSGTITFDEETYINIEGVKECPSTTAELYMIHETLARITESITNGCMTAKSEYYGRTDSAPYSFNQDGCGGLRSLTSGLKIRRAPEDKFYASLKDVIEGLYGIDNIGMGVEQDPVFDDAMILRVEPVEHFYQDNEMLRHAYVAEGDTIVEENKHYAKVNVGYKKWEVEGINGLGEFNSTREFSTSIDTITNSIDLTSNFVAGSFPIEVTRQQTFAESGGADTRYDNDIFIISMKRLDYPYGDIAVEQGGITSPDNIYSPDTIYNYRLSPLRNLMRWYKSIAAGFPNIGNSTQQLFFQSGTGNLIASGLLTAEDCRIEGVEITENQNIFTTHFADAEDYTPLWKPETITYEYDMSVSEYKTIKAAPYGYISVQCGTGEYLKYWIVEIKYKIAKGTASFQLRRKYGV